MKWVKKIKWLKAEKISNVYDFINTKTKGKYHSNFNIHIRLSYRKNPKETLKITII